MLSLSPITPRVARGLAPSQIPRPRGSVVRYTREDLGAATLASWTPEMVAQSMLDAGVEAPVADRFVENDINGAILITLKFEDLRELDISSFGVRTRIWHQIQLLRDTRPAEPRPATPIEDAPSREARRESRREVRGREAGDDDAAVRRSKSSTGSRRRRRRRPSAPPGTGGADAAAAAADEAADAADDAITPGESVSIIGIEQVLPKPHSCSKGENCSKWKKQQRTLDEFRRANPSVADVKAGGTFVVLSDVANPRTARAIDPNDVRPFSDAVPSVVASSDVLGPGGMAPLQYLQEVTLRNLRARDPQDNVRQFLDFQQPRAAAANEVPPTPPFQVVNQDGPPHGRTLRRLPRLSIPERPAPPRPAPPRSATVPPLPPPPATQQQQREPEFIPRRMDKADPISPDLETPRNPYRFGTPFSEMDVPVTAIPLGPIAREVSQSVPPDMAFHTTAHANPSPPRGARRPSFALLPALDENRPVRVATKSPSPRAADQRASLRPQQLPLQAPPRPSYPWSSNGRPAMEQAIPPTSTSKPAQTLGLASPPMPDGVSHQGPMKKRKTRMLRHEWQDGYFTIRGTRLNMHRDARALDRTLEYVDIDDYAIACSSLASQSKLTAAFKAVHLTSSHHREKSDPVGAFSFQLIPQDKDKVGARLRKRESSMPSGAAAAAAVEGVNGTGKSHHFAVKSRDDRIDWMRELMLAKALKQKGEGFEISVNGNMI